MDIVEETAVCQCYIPRQELLRLRQSESSNLKHKLRVGILRAIEQPSATGTRDEDSQNMQPRHKGHCEAIVSDFLHDFTILLKPVSNVEQKTRVAGLLSIVEDAMRLAIVLAAQHPHVEIRFLNDIKNSSFNMKDPAFKPSRGMKLEGDTEEKAEKKALAQGLLGRPFDLVIEPSVTRYGNKDGENYHRKKVLHRGEVWVVKDADLKIKEPAMADDRSAGQGLAAGKSPQKTTTFHESTKKQEPTEKESTPPENPHLEGKKAKVEGLTSPTRGGAARTLRSEIKLTPKMAAIDEGKIGRKEGTNLTASFSGGCGKRKSSTSSDTPQTASDAPRPNMPYGSRPCRLLQ